MEIIVNSYSNGFTRDDLRIVKTNFNIQDSEGIKMRKNKKIKIPDE